MTKKKDLYNLHCRIKHSTAEELKNQSEEMGISMGEVIDQLLEAFLHFCHKEEVEWGQTNINDTLKTLLEKVERIEKKVGA